MIPEARAGGAGSWPGEDHADVGGFVELGWVAPNPEGLPEIGLESGALSQHVWSAIRGRRQEADEGVDGPPLAVGDDVDVHSGEPPRQDRLVAFPRLPVG